MVTSRPAAGRPLQTARFGTEAVALHRTRLGTLAIHGPTGAWAYLDEREVLHLEALSGRTVGEAASLGLPPSDLAWLAGALWQRGIVSADGRRALDREAQDEEIAAISQATFVLLLLLSPTCNLDCSYCYLGLARRRPGAAMSLETGVDALERALARPEPRLVIDFGEIGGGQGLFRELVLHVRRRSGELGKRPVLLVQTNGTLIRPEDADFLQEHGFNAGVSIDGPAHLNDRARRRRGGGGTHAGILRGLELIIGKGIPSWLFATVAQHNVGHVEEVLAHLFELGGDYIFRPVLRIGEARDRWTDIGISVEEYTGFLRQAVRLALHGPGRIDVTRRRFLLRALGDPEGWRSSCTSRDCLCGTHMVVVEDDGRWAPCPRFAQSGEGTGQVACFPSPGRFALDVPASTREWPETCSACPWQRFCGGGCALAGREDPQCGSYRATFEALFEDILPEWIPHAEHCGPAGEGFTVVRCTGGSDGQ